MKKRVVNSSKLLKWPADKPLFKYMKAEHANKLFNCGTLRIGTLYEFRNLETYGTARGDEGEGTKEIYEHIDDRTIEDSSQNNPQSDFEKQFIKINGTVKNFKIVNLTFSESQDSADCYIYCMSKKFDDKLYEKFKTNVCVKINSPYKFINAISITLRGYNANFVQLSECKYGERKQQYGVHDDYHSSIIKPIFHKLDEEVRSIWGPNKRRNNYLKPLVIKLQTRHVKRYCEIFHKK